MIKCGYCGAFNKSAYKGNCPQCPDKQMSEKENDADIHMENKCEAKSKELYELYRREMGGIDVNGFALQRWELMVAHPEKHVRARAWRAVGEAALCGIE